MFRKISVRSAFALPGTSDNVFNEGLALLQNWRYRRPLSVGYRNSQSRKVIALAELKVRRLFFKELRENLDFSISDPSDDLSET